MNQRLIVIDGKTYNDLNEMPPDVRERYERAMTGIKDANNDGFSDFVENAQPNVVSNMMKFIVDGREYNSVEELPPEARARYEQAMGTFDRNRNGIPDFVEGMLGSANQTSNIQNNTVTDTPPRVRPIVNTQTIEPESSNSWMIALVIILLLSVCVLGAGAGWFFFVR